MRVTSYFIGLFVLTFTIGYSQTTWYVPSLEPTIQGAIIKSGNGDTIVVSAGTYYENLNFNGKAVTLISDQGPNVTIIDGSQVGSVVRFGLGEGANSVLDGFTITNGSGWDDIINPNNEQRLGGGILCDAGSSPTLQNNIITQNTVLYNSLNLPCGGGIACRAGSNPIIRDNVISNNISQDGEGGGCYIEDSSPVITGNHFDDNVSYRGGAIYGYAAYAPVVPTIQNNKITYNTATNLGGGIATEVYYNASNPVITDNLFEYNSAESGGAMSLDSYQQPAPVDGNVFANNTASFRAGGVALHAGKSTFSNNLFFNNICTNNTLDGYAGGLYLNSDAKITLLNNRFIKNAAYKGGGILCERSTLQLVGNTFNRNIAIMGGGLYSRGDSMGGQCNVTIANTIFWGDYLHSGNEGKELYVGTNSTVTISYSDVGGGPSSVYQQTGGILNWGSGMIDSNPYFVDPDGYDNNELTWRDNDHHIYYGSPCRDAGDNTVVTAATDFEGNPRIDTYPGGGTVDLGADEFYRQLYYKGFATPGGDIQIKFVDLPGTQPVALFYSDAILPAPIYGGWYLTGNLVGPIFLGPIPAGTGVLVMNDVIPLTTPTPATVYFQAVFGSAFSNLMQMDIE